MKVKLHSGDIANIFRAAAQQHQSVLISGSVGLDLISAAELFTEKIGGNATTLKPIDRKTGNIDQVNGKILVSQIRQLYQSTRTKSTKPQVVIISQAERMTLKSQGAFLKLLEEPHDNLHFILCSHRPGDLLPTILSRLSRIRLQKLSSEDSESLLTELSIADPTKRRQILFIANGLPDEIIKLSTDEAYFAEQVEIMQSAKQLLQGDAYQKLLVSNRLKDNRETALKLVDKALLIASQTIKSSPSVKVVSQLDGLLESKASLESNGNVRLALMRIML